MRLTLIDLLILGGLFLGGLGLGVLAAQILPESARPLGLLFGFCAIPVFAPAIYRRLHFRPLFLPKCPHCKKRPSVFFIAESQWPREVVVCADCRKAVEIWYESPASKDVSSAMPSLRSHWPQFLGIWRPVLRGDAT